MTTQWILIDVISILIENLALTYFFSKYFSSKYNSALPTVIIWAVASTFGIVVLFMELPVLTYEFSVIAVYMTYLIVFKNASFLHKILCFIIATAFFIGTSITGAFIAALVTDVSISHTLIYQDTSRLLAIILIKAMQIVLFYLLSKRKLEFKSLKKTSTFISSILVILVLSMLLFILSNVHELDSQFNSALVLISLGLLIMLIIVFLIYEMYRREESQNIELNASLQRLHMEAHYFKELDVIHSDIKKWRHDYKTNLVAIRELVKNKENIKAIEYIDSISEDTSMDAVTLQTGNMALDAVVSSKLWHANALNIAVKIHAIYPIDNCIKDNDLCAIVGNLLDNAIEANSLVESTNIKKFISLELLAKGKNLAISVINSYEGIIHKNGTRFLTNKDKRFNGIGIIHIDSIVDKYQGNVLREYRDGIFETHIIIPLVLL
ncbi:MAG: GHKL domain-containing protein [Oscillospiraceae bacterium]|jgi:hypothetical protein|nr:GHKL domain-containing protein [Oscillospiraceae bacterium]